MSECLLPSWNNLPLSESSLYALNCALNMYSGNSRILIQGAVSGAVQSACGLPPGCGLVVDLLHAFLIRTLQSAGRQVEVRKYVDDMVLVAHGPHFAHYLRDSYKSVQNALKQANMQVNPKKTAVICNGTHTKNKLTKTWCSGLLPPVKITTRDLGVDTLWSCWRTLCKGNVSALLNSPYKECVGLVSRTTSKSGLSNPSIVLDSMALRWEAYRKLVCPKYERVPVKPWVKELESAAGLRRSAPLELMAHGGPAADPQVSADLSTVRVWHRRILAGKLEWPLPDNMWDNALRPGRGRGPTRNLKQLAERLG
eukprot:973026-Amphidinium_carterae.1